MSFWDNKKNSEEFCNIQPAGKIFGLKNQNDNKIWDQKLKYAEKPKIGVFLRESFGGAFDASKSAIMIKNLLEEHLYCIFGHLQF